MKVEISPQKASAVHRLHGAAVGDTWKKARRHYLKIRAALGLAEPDDLKDYHEHEVWINRDHEVAYCVSIEFDDYQGWSSSMTKI